MPHLCVEHSANLTEQSDLDALCRKLCDTVLETGYFELGAIRVRTLLSAHYVVADDLPENAFANLILRIGAGRTLGQKKSVGQAILMTAEQHFAPLLARPHFALTVSIEEIDAELSWKTNAIHPRLRNK